MPIYTTVLAGGITNPALNLPYTEGSSFLQDIIPRIIELGFIIGILVFFFMLIFGAIQWMTAGGDKAAVEAARGRVMNAFVGLVILFALFAILRLAGGFFGIDLLQIDLGPLRVGGGSSGGSGCFLAGTKVQMADGTYKDIQEIKPGDFVYSYDLKTETLVKDKVENLIVHSDYPGGYLIINGQLKVTGNHNMWTVNRLAWKRADTLSVGDTLLSPDGEVAIKSIKWIDGTNTVYNLHLSGKDHNYFAEDILVHNQVKQ